MSLIPGKLKYPPRLVFRRIIRRKMNFFFYRFFVFFFFKHTTPLCTRSSRLSIDFNDTEIVYYYHNNNSNYVIVCTARSLSVLKQFNLLVDRILFLSLRGALFYVLDVPTSSVDETMRRKYRNRMKIQQV